MTNTLDVQTKEIARRIAARARRAARTPVQLQAARAQTAYQALSALERAALRRAAKLGVMPLCMYRTFQSMSYSGKNKP